MQGTLKKIALTDLVAHPDNPRLSLRDDVVDAIVAGICESKGFSEMHALIVREKDDKYQILSGHQRREAAEKAWLTEVPCWVVECSDKEAHMLLVTCNSQGELDPLEYGIHTLTAVPPEQGGRGSKGGLSAYSKSVGQKPSNITVYRQGAEVFLSVKNHYVNIMVFHSKAQHLAAIRSLDEALWKPSCDSMLKHEWSIADTKRAVITVKGFLDDHGLPDNWTDKYLPVLKVAEQILDGKTAGSFRQLAQLAEKVEADLPDDLAAMWRTWLEENAGGDSWDIKKCQDKRLEFEEMAFARSEFAADGEQIQVLLADPPWQYDFAETDNRQIENQYPTASVEDIIGHISSPLLAPPNLAEGCVLFLWATAPKLREALEVMEGWGFEYKTHAVWDKERMGMGYWFRGQHELLLVGTRGEMSPPEAANRFASVFREARSDKHSEKPGCVYRAIESMFPGLTEKQRWEMYQRQPRKGWGGSGNESDATRERARTA